MPSRRNLLHAGLAAPLLPMGLAACSRHTIDNNPYLAGNFGPVDIESTVTELPVTGSIPGELAGRFLRNGPNPPPDQVSGGYHWFTGRGMVHGVRLNEGRAEWYRCRAVAGSGANTNVIGHAGLTIAIVESGGRPQDLGYTLEPDGDNVTIGSGFSAHPNLDPDTGELHAMCYDWANLRDHVRYVVVDADGELSSDLAIPLPGMTMIHDMSLTPGYAVIYDLPVTLSFVALGTGASFPFRWDDDHEPRVGLLPRRGTPADIIWSSVRPGYVYHPMNAWEDPQGRVVIDLVRYERMFDEDVRGPFGDSLPRLDRWTINPASRTVSEEVVDPRPQEFPRTHPRVKGKPYRYGYTVAVEDYGFPTIYKHDLRTGTASTFSLGAGRHGGEPVFVPRPGTGAGDAEDDGYLMTFVFDQRSNSSDLIILDAQDLSRPPLAQIRLPVRVPYGFHGNWVPDSVTPPA